MYVYPSPSDKVLSEHGKEMTWDIKAGLMGKRTSPFPIFRFAHLTIPVIKKLAEGDAATHLLSFFPDLPSHFTIDHYLSSRRTIQDLLWPTVLPLPGTIKLIRHLHNHKIPIAVATSSQRRNFLLKSSHLQTDLFGYFEGKVVCADDGYLREGRGKPNPDIFLIAAREMLGRDVGEEEGDGRGVVSETQKAERAKGLVFEDAIPGVQAGKRAGMKGGCFLWFVRALVNMEFDIGVYLNGGESRVGPGSEFAQAQ